VSKIFGVVEGFYRRPYTSTQRLDLIEFLSYLRLNTYVYGPKSDPFHRRKWYKPYPKQKLNEFAELSERCKKKKINLIYALSPVYYPDLKRVIKKIASLGAIGISHFSIFFDDIKVRLDATTAEKQLHIVNGLYNYLREEIADSYLSFCPTQYHGFKETTYIRCIATNLNRKVDIFWTGKNVVSLRISKKDIEKITRLMGRPILIWDNIFANDYIPDKIMRFPYRNRAPEIIRAVRGILINPMNNYTDSKPLIHTAAQFFKNPYTYDPKQAWKKARTYTENANICRT